MTRSLLLVDDDDDFRTTLRHFLSDEGYDVHTARDGREALARLGEIDKPCLILLDLTMPGMDGSQFLVERGRDAQLARIPVVVMSAWTRDREDRTVGAESVLMKPIKPEELLALVERYCARQTRGVSPPR